MSDSDPKDGPGAPEAPDLSEAMSKLRSATEMLRQLNDETGAVSPGLATAAQVPQKPPQS